MDPVFPRLPVPRDHDRNFYRRRQDGGVPPRGPLTEGDYEDPVDAVFLMAGGVDMTPDSATPSTPALILIAILLIFLALFACPRAQADDVRMPSCPAGQVAVLHGNGADVPLSFTCEPAVAPAPEPKARPGWLHVNAVGGVAHDVRSGWKKPVVFAVEVAIGPLHYGPLYVGGAGSYQGSDGVGVAVPMVTYVARGRFFGGLFRGAAFQVGFRKRDGFSGPTAYYFLVGGSR